MIGHEFPEHFDAHVHEVRGRVVGLGVCEHRVRQQLIGTLTQGVEEEAFLGAKQAVDRASAGSDPFGDGAYGDAGRAALAEQLLGCRSQRLAGLVIVLARSSHGLTTLHHMLRYMLRNM